MLIDGLSVDDQRQHVSALGQDDLGHLELAPGRTAMQVSYLAPGFGPMDGMRYQIRLEGVDQDWSAPYGSTNGELREYRPRALPVWRSRPDI